MTKPGPKPGRRPFPADDPRHGSYAGARAHAAKHERPCAPCREARRKWRAENDKKKPPKPKERKEHPPSSSLGKGHWTTGSMIRTWVPDNPEEFAKRRAA